MRVPFVFHRLVFLCFLACLCAFAGPAGGTEGDLPPAGLRLVGPGDAALLFSDPGAAALVAGAAAILEAPEEPEAQALLKAAADLRKALEREPGAPLGYAVALTAKMLEAFARGGPLSLDEPIALMRKAVAEKEEDPLRRKLLLVLESSAMLDAGQEGSLCEGNIGPNLVRTWSDLTGMPAAPTDPTPALPDNVLPRWEGKKDRETLAAEWRARAGRPRPTLGAVFEDFLGHYLDRALNEGLLYISLVVCGAAVPEREVYYANVARMYYSRAGGAVDLSGEGRTGADRKAGPALTPKAPDDWRTFLMTWYREWSDAENPAAAIGQARLLAGLGLPQAWAEENGTPAGRLIAGNMLAQWYGFTDYDGIPPLAVEQYLLMFTPDMLEKNAAQRLDPGERQKALDFLAARETATAGDPAFPTARAGLLAFYTDADKETKNQALALLDKALDREKDYPPAIALQKALAENHSAAD